MEAAERLNKVGMRLKEEGLSFTWHNHHVEFVEIEGKTAYDWVVQYADPAWVNMQMDIYWVYKGNYDPLSLINKYPGRFKLLHIKDMDRTKEKEMNCPGEGEIDFKGIFQQWEQAGIAYATVENERNKAGIHCAQISLEFLKSL